ncbi:AraC family transcriptional regulator [Achromobacter sp. NCFB-sbj8-Ac1-l]|uniref:AraC family transcriptional regulator n=1 Tax=unclassified Achromobacter TaxID=2626865 RepID=UPI0040469619
MTAPKSSNQIDYQGLDRPLGAMPKEYPDGHHSRPHQHPRDQLMYAVQGVMQVRAAGSLWLVPPRTALWMPAGVVHETRMRGKVSLRTAYLAPGLGGGRGPTLTGVSPLLHELLLRAVDMPMDYDEAGKDGLIARLLMQEIDWRGLAHLDMPWPVDARLRRIHDHLLRHPADADGLAAWADRLGLSERTLARLFVRELGMGFTAWRHRLRLMVALSRLGQGAPVGVVAHETGYATASAFAAMFKRLTGRLPSDQARRTSALAPA